MFTKISLPVFIRQMFIFLHNKRLLIVYNVLSLLLLIFLITNTLFAAIETIMSNWVIEVHSILCHHHTNLKTHDNNNTLA